MSDQCKRLKFFNSINVFPQPGKKIRRYNVTNFFASDEIFYLQNFMSTFFPPISYLKHAAEV